MDVEFVRNALYIHMRLLTHTGYAHLKIRHRLSLGEMVLTEGQKAAPVRQAQGL